MLLLVQGAYMTSLDRWGFNVVGATGLNEDGGVAWREFRFAFQSEVHNVKLLRELLYAMEREAVSTTDMV